MKKLIIFAIFSTALSGSFSFAQKPVFSGAAAQSTSSRELRKDEKKEELSKRLMQRKNELRKEEHDRSKERRNADAHEKSSKQ